MVGNEKLLVDRFAIATGGHNSGDDPEVLTAGQFSNGKNVTVRGGRVKSRPRFIKRMSMPSGRYQGLYYFRPNRQLIARVGGKLHVMYPDNGVTSEISGVDSNPNRDRVWFETVGNLLVMQDGQQFPSVFDGNNAWMVDPGTTPVGTVMRFANGRLHVASSGARRVLSVGDIMQGTDATTALQFTEASFLTGGGDFAFTSPITALMEMPVMDTASGQGSMIIGTEESIHSLHTEITARDNWQDIQGFQANLLPGIGMVGSRALTRVNTDIYFQAPGGLRSLRLATTDMKSPGLGGLQQEIPEHFKGWRGGDTSVVHFDDRLLVLTAPRILNGRTVYDGMVAMNFDTLNHIGEKSAPVFDGFWDGLPIREMIEADQRCFAVVVGSSGDELWELLRDGDERADETPSQYIDTRAMNAGDPGGLKAMTRLDLWLSDVMTDVELKVSFKADDAPGFTPWDTVDLTLVENNSYNPGPGKRHVSRVTLATPPETHNIGYNFQIRVAWEGRCRLDLLQAYMRPMFESRYADNEPLTLSTDDSIFDQSHIRNYI